MLKMHELEPGMSNVEFKAIISQATIGKTNGAKKRNYLNLILEDSTGEMDAKFWSPTDEDLQNCVQGVVVQGLGDIINYNGAKQMKVIKLDVLEATDEERLQYLKSAPINPDVMMQEIDATINGMKDPDYQAITRNLIDEHREAFMTYPAAIRNHHDFVSGLLYHTYCMLKIAKGIAAVYGDLNEDLLYAGVILHDLGKVVELSGPITPFYTTEGNLLGHISIGNTMIKETCDLLDISGEKATLLQHMILSHHGKQEYGSPVLPQIKEAEILSLVDNIDARHQMFDKAYDQVSPGETTKRIFALENRTLYRPKEKTDD